MPLIPLKPVLRAVVCIKTTVRRTSSNAPTVLLKGQADHVAAMNLVQRADDREITRYMPHGVVKQVLTTRFQRSVEGKLTAGQSSTQQPDCNEQDTRHGAEKALTSAASRKARNNTAVSPVHPSVSEHLIYNATLVDVGRF